MVTFKMMDIYEEACKVLEPFAEGLDIHKTLVKPPKPEYGEISSRICFDLAKIRSLKPLDVAKEIVSKISIPKDHVFQRVKEERGFINFYVNYGVLSRETLREIVVKGDDFGKSNVGKGRKILVEHTSPNPNKPLHIGILRNTCLGDSLSRILSFNGFNVVIANYIDDSGSQVADNILAHIRLGYPLDPPQKVKFDHYSGRIYAEVNSKYEENPELMEEKRKIIKLIEEGNNEVACMAEKIVKKVVMGQLETCWRINAFFHLLNWETHIIKEGFWKKALSFLQSKNVVRKSENRNKEGCIVFDLGNFKEFEGLKDKEEVLVRSDGTLMYVAKDIAYAMWKLGVIKEDFKYDVFCKQPNGKRLWTTTLNRGREGHPSFRGFDLAITVIDDRQTHSQNIVKASLKLAGKDKRYIHYGYKLVALSSETVKAIVGDGLKEKRKIFHMAGRKGIVVNGDDVLDKLEQIAYEETRKRNPEASSDWICDVSRKIAVSALRFELTKMDRDKPMIFDLERAVELKENTGPYIQYSHARACRILEKAGDWEKKYSMEWLEEEEKRLVFLLYHFPLTVKKCCEEMSPQLLCKYLTDLSTAFNQFYQKIPVIKAGEKGKKDFRLTLVFSVKQVLKNGLNLLGIDPLTKM